MNQTINNNHLPRTNGTQIAALTLTAIGVVFGDIGTSPLYAIRGCFQGLQAINVTPHNVLGIISLVFWSLILIISVKYLAFVLNADNRGEGGVLALMTLLTRDKKENSLLQMVFIALGIFGASLLFGDGIVTPAISVLSAVEGLNVATSVFQSSIVPISIVILTLLFFFQHRGTARIGYVFGPILLVWFFVLSVLGIISIIKAPEILAAVNPYYAVNFFAENKWQGFSVLGIVFLALTGGEALYADMGHFGKTPIRFGWFTVVLPSLLLNYFGQGAHLLRRPDVVDNLFFQLAPSWALYPMVVLATTATIIASQAIISGAFSVSRQAVQLGFLPRMAVIHTSDEKIGQVYIPIVNWILFVGTISLIIGFRESSNLASAYGVAVSADMVITTIFTAFVAQKLWSIKKSVVIIVAGLFLLIDLSFFSSNVTKLTSGAWVPLALSGIVFVLIKTWKQGRDILRKNFEAQALDIQLFVHDLKERKPTRVPGVAVFLTGNATGTPRTLLHNFKHNKIIHEHTVLLTVKTEEIPYVRPDERIEFESIGAGMYRIQLKYGFSEDPDIPEALQKIDTGDLRFEPMRTTYFLGRETLLISGRSKMAKWRKKLFAYLSHNAFDATGFFHLPPNRVIELGLQVEL
ncbi:MAG: potassium transporter Kup [Kiritimatiellae bacterium]|nr:potassium transporter Kup [Kiritimatiellia bacterium]MDD5522158.1 potassium transporter Kup [Kiritimatiellia bacterium]